MQIQENRRGRDYSIFIDPRYGRATGQHVHRQWLRMLTLDSLNAGPRTVDEVMEFNASTNAMKVKCYLEEAESLAAQSSNPSELLLKLDALQRKFDDLCGTADHIGIAHGTKQIENDLSATLGTYHLQGFEMPVVAADPFETQDASRDFVHEFDQL